VATLSLALSSGIAQAQASPVDRFIGNWLGTLVTPGGKLRIGLAVAKAPDGSLSGGMTSVDQGNTKIPGTLAMHADTLVVSMPVANATFRAVFSAADDSLHGSFIQGAPLPLNMGRSAAPTAVNHPQEPKPPFPYEAVDVSFESAPGVRIAGTLI